MLRRPPRSTRTDTLFPYTTLFRSGCAGYAVDLMNKIRRALEVGGPTFVHTLDPWPKGWDYHPQYSQELGHLAVECGIWPLYEVLEGRLNLTGDRKSTRLNSSH